MTAKQEKSTNFHIPFVPTGTHLVPSITLTCATILLPSCVLYIGHPKQGRCKVAPESWGIGGSKMVSSRGLEGYEMFDPKDSRREDKEEENA